MGEAMRKQALSARWALDPPLATLLGAKRLRVFIHRDAQQVIVRAHNRAAVVEQQLNACRLGQRGTHSVISRHGDSVRVT